MPKKGIKRRVLIAGRCHYCGCQSAIELTVDHLLPLSRGGSWEPSNLVCSCILCNLAKDTMTEAEFHAEVEAHGMPWMRPALRPAFELRRAHFIQSRERMRRESSARKEQRKAARAADRIESLEMLLTYLELMFNAPEQEAG